MVESIEPARDPRDARPAGVDGARRHARRARRLRPVAAPLHRSEESPPALRIALLSPYAGGNLGDGAMQDAVIRNLRRRAAVSLVGIYLAPRRAAPMHGIPAFGITGRYGDWADPAVALPAPSTDAAQAPPRLRRTRESLKRLPGLGPMLRRAINAGRRIWAARREPGHLRRSVHFARSLDAIVLTGGGQLDELMRGPFGHPYAMFRWAMIARWTGTPLLVLSIGRGDLYTRLGRWFVGRTLAAADYRSYRDAGTLESLRAWAFTRGDPVVPDLAFSDAPTAARADDPDAPLHVAISPTVFGHPELWPTDGGPDAHARYVETLVELAVHVLERGDRLSLFVSADSDRPVLDMIRRGLAARVGDARAAAIALLPCDTPRALEEALGQVDVVVGSRLHSVILAHRAGCTALAISSHRKLATHMAMMGEQDVCVGIEATDASRLVALFDRLAADRPAHAARIRDRLRTFEQELQAQYDRVVEIVGQRSRQRRRDPASGTDTD